MRWSWCVLALCGSVRQAGACECDDDTRDTATILREYETVFVGSVLRDVDDDACGETDDTQVLVHVDEVFAGTASEWELVTLRACAAAPPALWLPLVPLLGRRRRQVLHEHAGC